MKRVGTATGSFFQLAKYIPGASFYIACFSADEQPGELVPFYTDTEEKILRLPTTENKISIGDDISKRDLRLERVEMSSQFCFLRWTIFIRIFSNSVCIERTRRSRCSSMKKHTIKKEAFGIYFASRKNIPWLWFAGSKKAAALRIHIHKSDSPFLCFTNYKLF